MSKSKYRNTTKARLFSINSKIHILKTIFDLIRFLVSTAYFRLVLLYSYIRDQHFNNNNFIILCVFNYFHSSNLCTNLLLLLLFIMVNDDVDFVIEHNLK